ncbi:MAG: PQQ-binding-like beta-propeller repeat protein [Armatimonadetes bacterium]|nr:PQQ-binding-like beta-propeller repeat protein [Armatimonadota bacterium]
MGWGAEEDVLSVLNADGRIRWSYRTNGPGPPEGLPVAVGRFVGLGRQVVVGSTDGTLTLLDRNGQVTAQAGIGQGAEALRTLQRHAPSPDVLVVLTSSACTAYEWKVGHTQGAR